MRAVHTQGQRLVCRPWSARVLIPKGRHQEASQAWRGWKEAERAPDTGPDEGALPQRAQIAQHECRLSEAPRVPALQLRLHTDMPATGVPPNQLLNQHAASLLSRPRGNGVSVSPSRPPDPQAKPLKPVPRCARKPGEARGEAHSSQNAVTGPGSPGTGKALAVLHPTPGGVHAPAQGDGRRPSLWGKGHEGEAQQDSRHQGMGHRWQRTPGAGRGQGSRIASPEAPHPSRPLSPHTSAKRNALKSQDGSSEALNQARGPVAHTALRKAGLDVWETG